MKPCRNGPLLKRQSTRSRMQRSFLLPMPICTRLFAISCPHSNTLSLFLKFLLMLSFVASLRMSALMDTHVTSEASAAGVNVTSDLMRAINHHRKQQPFGFWAKCISFELSFVVLTSISIAMASSKDIVLQMDLKFQSEVRKASVSMSYGIRRGYPAKAGDRPNCVAWFGDTEIAFKPELLFP